MTVAAAKATACWDEPHCRSIVVPGTDSGQPAASGALRPMLKVCSPTWLTQPQKTSSTTAGSMPDRSASAVSTCAERSTACTPGQPSPALAHRRAHGGTDDGISHGRTPRRRAGARRRGAHPASIVGRPRVPRAGRLGRCSGHRGGGETAALAVVARRPRARRWSSSTPPGGCWSARPSSCCCCVVARDLLARPRLSAGPDGVDVRTLDRAPAPAVGPAARAGAGDPAAGRSAAGPWSWTPPPARTTTGVLVVLGRRDLGADPEEVARALRAPGPPRS